MNRQFALKNNKLEEKKNKFVVKEKKTIAMAIKFHSNYN